VRQVSRSSDLSKTDTSDRVQGTLRTNWSDPQEFDYTDLCAIEIAQEHGYSHLFEVLAPVIRNAVPNSVLEKLTDRFHNIIRNDLASFTNQEHLRLPQLSPLTEMIHPEMWFPLKAVVGHGPNSPRVGTTKI
jgi:hypothetical protein